MAVAFFDLDKTLLAANSGVLWLRRELAEGHISRLQALRASVWLARYHLGFVSMEDALLRAIAQLAGTEAAPIVRRTEAFYAEQVRALYRPGALEALARHRRAGDRCVLLTSSSGYLSELVAKDLSLDAVLCNRFEVDAAGRHTGRPLGGLCFGSGKLAHAQAYLASLGGGVGLRDCAFYTDSYSDLPVLAAVGHPVAVNPDPRLRREALRRGWPVVDWGTPGLAPAPANAKPPA
ncbi:HAD-IB family hydrolase [Aggregicoccus sp. 17bor-14]|uniref:HAD family hydrolase n=1 Tax=Myxococcaceae TaxID=31 RepID=UPI00129C1A17|nr:MULTISPECIES: HAD-IB family hydrolase [Myxococcaceae]MBF5041413.1 HAD-IB family hydrolase [Simulacricoccus sp. 17bor-14]MRI87197.1 HAD-IB family hydrolase [Aggregicoccus sp. 17bor-14]